MSASREKRLRRELRDAELGDESVKKTKKKKQKKPMTAAKSKKIHSAIGYAVTALIVIAFALLIFVNSGYLQTNATAATVNDHKLTPVEFNYFYQDSFYRLYSQYNSYGMWSYMGLDDTQPIEKQDCILDSNGGTWGEYLTQSALDTALQTYVLYDAALEAGYTLDEEAQNSIDSTKASIESAAESGNFKNVDDYLEENYGKGATLESYIQYITAQQIASSYATEKEESYSYSDSDLRSYYDENSQEFDKVTYRVFDVATDSDDASAAKNTADAMQAELDGTEESFIKAAQNYAPEDMAESYEDESYTLKKSQLYSSVSTDYADWLFSDSRVAGESQVIATDSGYSVVMFLSRDNNDYNTVNVRHILIQVATSGTDDDGNAVSTDSDWSACKEAIEAIEAEWLESDMTEDTFAEMAEEKSEDTGSAANGGLIEDISKGQMVEDFENWCFEPHEVGDTGIVKSTNGYHLIYFSGTGEEYWKTLADDAKRDDDYTSWYEDYSADYSAKKNVFGQWFTHKELPSV